MAVFDVATAPCVQKKPDNIKQTDSIVYHY